MAHNDDALYPHDPETAEWRLKIFNLKLMIFFYLILQMHNDDGLTHMILSDPERRLRNFDLILYDLHP